MRHLPEVGPPPRLGGAPEEARGGMEEEEGRGGHQAEGVQDMPQDTRAEHEPGNVSRSPTDWGGKEIGN